MTDPSSEDSDGQYDIDEIRDNQAVAFGPGAQASVTNIIHKAPPPPPTWPLYANIPALPKTIVGRADLLTHLVARLCAGTTTALSAEELPRVGKTTLAVALAHFRDGVLWAGLDPNAVDGQRRRRDLAGQDLGVEVRHKGIGGEGLGWWRHGRGSGAAIYDEQDVSQTAEFRLKQDNSSAN
jgi:hypothetical protein